MGYHSDIHLDYDSKIDQFFFVIPQVVNRIYKYDVEINGLLCSRNDGYIKYFAWMYQ